MTAKATSLRLPEEQMAELGAVARADEMTVSHAVREAIDKHIADRRSDPGFQERLERVLQEDREILERLRRA